MHVLTPNIYRTLSESLQTFDYITKMGNFGWMDGQLARWSGVAIMAREISALRILMILTPVSVHAVAHAAEEAARHHRRARGVV